jgi:hypothetical protein
VVVVIFVWQAANDVAVALLPSVPSTTSLVVVAVAVIIFAWWANNCIAILVVANRAIIDPPCHCIVAAIAVNDLLGCRHCGGQRHCLAGCQQRHPPICL